MVILFLYTPTVRSIKYQAESSFVVWKRGHEFKVQMELKSLNSTFIYIKQ